MQINPISYTSFGAKLIRNAKVTADAEGNIHDKGTTKQDLVDSYNSQILKLKKQRDAALELDSYMHSPEMKKCLECLPKGDEIEIINKFSYMETDGNGKTSFDPMFLMYKFNDPESIDMVKRSEALGITDADEKLSICYVQDKNGNIDKSKINRYILDIARFLGVSKK